MFSFGHKSEKRNQNEHFHEFPSNWQCFRTCILEKSIKIKEHSLTRQQSTDDYSLEQFLITYCQSFLKFFLICFYLFEFWKVGGGRGHVTRPLTHRFTPWMPILTRAGQGWSPEPKISPSHSPGWQGPITRAIHLCCSQELENIIPEKLGFKLRYSNVD